MPSKKDKPTPRLTAEVAMKMTPTIGAPPSEVRRMQDAKAAPEKSAKVKPRSAKARFTGALPKTSASKNSTLENRRSRGKS
ncbi:MAG: hypothetical protein JO216_14805 [Hyphomicrobiales bacterium]|nr:hypothetical protein [Hyphomicrobiales bacterium]MBW0004749.1 hypothetical protein [Hyphomicrobiales bacterium]